MSKPLLIDLFCGAGGASEGYRRAGFRCVGLDLKPQKRYPFDFAIADLSKPWPFNGSPALVHASPPCQGYSPTRAIHGRRAGGIIDEVREWLMATDAPWVIENVPGARHSMRTGLFTGSHTITLCGEMFGLRVIRHRLFECSWPIRQKPHLAHKGLAQSFDRPRRKGEWHYVTVAGHNYLADEGREAMGIDWMTCDELSQAVPPAYTEWIGREFLKRGRNHP